MSAFRSNPFKLFQEQRYSSLTKAHRLASMSLFASTSKYVFPVMRTAHQTIRSASSLSSSIRVPYTLHAQCSSNNTILTVSVDSSYSSEWGQAGGQVEAGDQPHAGRKIFSMSTGQEGFKKAQRGTFEAATATLLSCFKKMEGLLEDRGFAKTSFSRK